MQPSTATVDPTREHLAQLMQFLNWLTPVIFVFSLVYAGTALIFGDIATGISSGVIFGYGVVLLAARWSLAQKQVQISVQLVCLGFLASALMIVLAQPLLYPNMVIIPLLVVAIALPYLHGSALWRLLVLCWVAVVVIAAIGIWRGVTSEVPRWFTNLLQVSTIAGTTAFGLFLLWQFHRRLARLFHEMQATHSELQQAYTEVQERANTQSQLLAALEQQHSTIDALSVPILPIAKQTWLLPLLGWIDQQRLEAIQARTLDTLYTERGRLLIVDMTGITSLAHEIATGLRDLVQSVRLLGAEVVIVGIRAEVAQTMTQSAVLIEGVRVERDVTVALEQVYAMLHGHSPAEYGWRV